MDRDLAREARTLFELCPPASNIFSGISRGTGVRRNAAYFRRIPYVFWFLRTGDWDPIDRQGCGFLLRAAARPRERFTFHTTLSVDEYSHKHGPFAARVKDAYRSFDRVIGELGRTLAASGQLDRTLLLLSADHGHTEVAQHLDMEGFFERRGLRTLYFPFAPQRWFGCDAAVMVGGNGMAHVSLRGRHGWRVRPSGDELLAQHPGLTDDLLGEDAVHLLAWRAADPPDAIRVRTRAGEALVRAGEGMVEYRVTRGADPLGYPSLPARMTRDELLARTEHGEYPDAPLQLAQLFESPRTGDLVISAHQGFDLRARFERWDHRSCHGTLHRDHIQVPFASSHRLRPGPWRTADVFPTVLAALGQPIPDSDGRNLLN
jgi:arylsulfatase A-like enzyme